ncbi:MAG: imidazoleglycerol-phosphate dehydratase HisB [Lentisphaerae bacterium]|jgi:imidazoleglycerol-phosphate dehydratase|nr:imidazoleglycerol-phosphate dehydratase HisB [Lentisphaerota bacterium]
MKRIGKQIRKTRETKIAVELDLDGSGKSEISTGIGFMDHMLELFARHGKFDLKVQAAGDLEVDAHHTMEDLGLVMGEVFSQALGDKAGIRRYGSFLLPMDETLVLIALDLSGRPYLVYDLVPPVEKVGTLDTALFHEFFQAFCVKGGINLHVKLMTGGEIHHIFEAVFKGLARALEQAVSHDPKEKGIPSTKGIL